MPVASEVVTSPMVGATATAQVGETIIEMGRRLSGIQIRDACSFSGKI